MENEKKKIVVKRNYEKPNSVSALENSDNFKAEKVLNVLATIILWLGKIFCVLFPLVGIGLMLYASAADRGYGVAEIYIGVGIGLIIYGLIVYFLHLLIWAAIRVQINISYRLTKLDMKNAEEKESK